MKKTKDWNKVFITMIAFFLIITITLLLPIVVFLFSFEESMLPTVIAFIIALAIDAAIATITNYLLKRRSY